MVNRTWVTSLSVYMDGRGRVKRVGMVLFQFELKWLNRCLFNRIALCVQPFHQLGVEQPQALQTQKVNQLGVEQPQVLETQKVIDQEAVRDGRVGGMKRLKKP